MAQLKVSQIKSGIGGKHNQRHTLRTLGLRRVGDVSVQEDRPEVRGMLATVQHLVSFEEVGAARRSTEEQRTEEQSTEEVN